MEQSSKASPTLVVPANRHHPFYPADSRVPGYIAISTPTVVLLMTFFGGVLMILTMTKCFLRSLKPKLSNSDIWTASWFVLCGFIHTSFEGYFSYHSLQMGGRTDLFGQLWKEYSLSDSRYMTQDSFVVCMETVTACLWGPLSFVCAYMIVTDHISRHSVQFTISFGQLYGLALYYATCAFEEMVHGVVLSHPSLKEMQTAFALKARANAMAP